MRMTLKGFNNRYRYKSDETQYGRVEHWAVIPTASVMEGDCEDYVLTLKDKVVGFEGLELYYCKIGNGGHCIGKLGDMWIDCNFKKLRKTLPSSYHSVRKFTWFNLLVKKAQAWFNRTFR